MEETFYDFGVLFLRWEDKDGNIWEAVKEQVDKFGKECFEHDPMEMSSEEYEKHMETYKWINGENILKESINKWSEIYDL